MEDRCVICGELVPEGSQVCRKCYCDYRMDTPTESHILVVGRSHKSASQKRLGHGWSRLLFLLRIGHRREE